MPRLIARDARVEPRMRLPRRTPRVRRTQRIQARAKRGIAGAQPGRWLALRQRAPSKSTPCSELLEARRASEVAIAGRTRLPSRNVIHSAQEFVAIAEHSQGLSPKLGGWPTVTWSA